jgi:hypothetical protein
MRSSFENFYVMGVSVEWCPTSIRGYAPAQNASPQGVVGPFLWSDDPDNYSQNAYTDDQRVNLPTYELKDASRPFKVYRSNAMIYSNGKIPAADCSAT